MYKGIKDESANIIYSDCMHDDFMTQTQHMPGQGTIVLWQLVKLATMKELLVFISLQCQLAMHVSTLVL